MLRQRPAESRKALIAHSGSWDAAEGFRHSDRTYRRDFAWGYSDYCKLFRKFYLYTGYSRDVGKFDEPRLYHARGPLLFISRGLDRNTFWLGCGLLSHSN